MAAFSVDITIILQRCTAIQIINTQLTVEPSVSHIRFMQVYLEYVVDIYANVMIPHNLMFN